MVNCLLVWHFWKQKNMERVADEIIAIHNNILEIKDVHLLLLEKTILAKLSTFLLKQFDERLFSKW